MFNIKFSIERWKFNEEYNVYVSNEGRVKNINKKDIKFKVNKHGYLAVKTSNKTISVHRLVMITWCPLKNYENMTVDHLNHNKRDNSVKNLEWVSEEENLKRANDDFISEEINEPEVVNGKNIEDLNESSFIKLNKVKMSRDEAKSIISFFICPEGTDDEKKKIFRKINIKINQVISTGLPKSYFGFLIERV